MMTPPKRRAMFFSLVLVLSVPAASASEEDPPAPGSMIRRSIPPPGATTHLVIPGERFRTSPFRRWFYGSNYRDLWTTPVEVQVLDLDRVGGGLTPLRTGGFGQSISLHFTGQDGRRYTVRSLDKDATRRVPGHRQENGRGRSPSGPDQRDAAHRGARGRSPDGSYRHPPFQARAGCDSG